MISKSYSIKAKRPAKQLSVKNGANHHYQAGICPIFYRCRLPGAGKEKHGKSLKEIL
jgi:hypothetical protein